MVFGRSPIKTKIFIRERKVDNKHEPIILYRYVIII